MQDYCVGVVCVVVVGLCVTHEGSGRCTAPHPKSGRSVTSPSRASPWRGTVVKGLSNFLPHAGFLVKAGQETQNSGVIEKLISGGQTGADIAALDVALRFKFPHGGWCPKGRRSLEGPIHTCYNLMETPSESYLQRTEWNVRDSDCTVVFTLAPEASGGSLRTLGFAKKHGKPSLHLSRHAGVLGYRDRSELLQNFVREHEIKKLNVAGSRESKEPCIHRWVMEVLENAFFWEHLYPATLGGPGEG